MTKPSTSFIILQHQIFKIMKQTFSLFKKTATWASMAALLVVFLCSTSRLSAQVSLSLVTGYQININGLGSTICAPSSASILNIPGSFPLWLDANNLSTNAGTYHKAEAGKTTIVIVDIPNVGYLSWNTSLYYRYGVSDGTYTVGTAAQSTTPPPGYLSLIHI